MSDSAVSQALRLLRTAGAVAGEKEGRVVRYAIVDPVVADLLGHCAGDNGPTE